MGLLVAFVLAISPARAETVELTVPWVCHQTLSATASQIPATEDITIRFDSETGRPTDSSRMTELLNIASAQNGTVDFHACFMRFWSQASAAADVHIDALSISTDAKDVRKQAFANLIYAPIERYGAAALRRGAVPPVAPGGDFRPPLATQEMTEMAAEFDRGCGSHMDSRFLDGTFIRTKLADVARGMGTDCLREAGQNYAQLLLDTQLSEAECARSGRVRECRLRREALLRALALLSTASPELAPYWAGEESFNTDCGRNFGALNRSLQEFLMNGLDAAGCQPMADGETRVYRGFHGSPVYRSYALTRIGDLMVPGGGETQHYRATLNFRFERDGVADPALTERMNQRVRDCFNEATPRLHNHATGDHLRLALAVDVPELSGANAPPPYRVSIVSTGRTNQSNWHEDEDCPSIIHEAMHTLGLVDEYEERAWGHVVNPDGTISSGAEQGTRPDFDCRVIGPPNSLMSGHVTAWKDTAPRSQLEICSCPDGQTSGACLTAALSSGCPSDRRRVEVKEPEIAGDIGETRSEAHGNGVIYRKTEVTRPLLFPGQLRAVLQPGCTAPNRIYYSCASQSRRTSRAQFGQDRCSIALEPECAGGGEEWLQ